MAHRFHLPRTGLANGSALVADASRQALLTRDRIVRQWSQNSRLFLWQSLWLPYWVGSDRPSPSLPRDLPATGSTGGTALTAPARYVRSSMGGLVRRFWVSWTVASVLRGVWLSLLLSFVWILLSFTGVASPPSMLAVGSCVVALAGLGLIFGVLNPPTASMVAAMLDRTFLLQERLTTASDAFEPEADRANEHQTVPRLQMADAANVLNDVQLLLPRPRFVPVREIVGVLIGGMALLTAIFAYVPDRPLPGIAESPIPAFVPASQRLADPQVPDQQVISPPSDEQAPSTVADVQEQSRSSQTARDDLGTIGKALEDNPMTQPASEAIANGDYATATDAIRSAANDAPGMSQDERNALADELDKAAAQVSGENPELADASREAADGLREGGAESTEGLSGLADQVDETGERVVPPDQLAEDLEEAAAAASGEQGSGSEATGNDSGGNQQSQDATGQTGEAGAGALSDPGEGVAAAPGVSNPDQQGPQPGSSSDQPGGDSAGGQGQEGAGAAPEGGAGQPAQESPADGGASSGNASGEGDATSSGESGAAGGASQGLTGGPAEETTASQGSGAGTGQTGANDASQSEQTVDLPAPAEGADPEADVPQDGAASDEPPRGSGQPGAPEDSGAVSSGSSSLVLEGRSDNGVRTGSDSGSSSLGSGSGAGTASGDQVQGEVGVAGPDSNRVPEDKRDIVGDYFSGPEGAP